MKNELEMTLSTFKKILFIGSLILSYQGYSKDSFLDFSGGYSTFYRYFSEHRPSPSLSRENGFIQGALIEGSIRPFTNYYASGKFSFHTGLTDYTGSEQYLDGSGHAGFFHGKTDNDFFETELNIGQKFSNLFSFYCHLGHHYWIRYLGHKRHESSEKCYDEHFSWYYLGLGISSALHLSRKNQLNLEFRLRHTLFSTMKVLNHGLEKKDLGSVNLGQGIHPLFNIGFESKLNHKLSFKVNSIMEAKPIGKSNHNKAYGYHEPSSSTFLWGFNCSLTLKS